MTCSWRWFIHPAAAINKNRNGSRTLGISLVHYREPQACSDEPARIQADPVSGPYGVEGEARTQFRLKLKDCLDRLGIEDAEVGELNAVAEAREKEASDFWENIEETRVPFG